MSNQDEGKSSGRASSPQGAGWKPGDPIGYIRQEIPEFEAPAYQGQRYEALVPDTLDLQERAAFGVRGITGPTDPLAEDRPFRLRRADPLVIGKEGHR